MTPMGPNNPIPQFDFWDDAIEFIENVSKIPKELDELQKEIINFYVKYKKNFQLKIKNVIDKAYKDAYGHDC